MKRTPRWLAVYFTPLALIGLCLLGELSVFRVGVDDLDEGYFVQQAVRVLHAQVPYRDFQTLYTPGLLYTHAALFNLLGGPSLLAPRGLALLTRAATAALLYVLAKPMLSRSWLAALPPVFLLVGLDDAPVRWEPHPGWLSTFFALVATWCLTHRATRGWLLMSGVAAGVSFLFKQNTGLVMLGALLARGALPAWFEVQTKPDTEAGRLRRVLGLPCLAFVALTAAWLTPLLIALGGRVRLLGEFVGAVNQQGLLSPPEPLVLVPLLCLGGGVWLARRSGDRRLRWYLLAGLALFLTQYPRMDSLHLVWSAPLLLVVGSMVLDRVRPTAWLIVSLPPVLLCLPTVLSRLDFIRQATTPIVDVPLADSLLVPPATAVELRAVVADVQRRTQPGEPIFVYPTSPLLYVLADRPNPTEFDHLNPGAADPEQIDALIGDLAASDVRLVVVSDFWTSAWGPPGPNARVIEWIDTSFKLVARYGAYRVLQAAL